MHDHGDGERVAHARSGHCSDRCVRIDRRHALCRVPADAATTTHTTASQLATASSAIARVATQPASAGRAALATAMPIPNR